MWTQEGPSKPIMCRCGIGGMTPMTDLEKQINVITILNCDRCCDSVKDMARRGKAFNHCCCKGS